MTDALSEEVGKREKKKRISTFAEKQRDIIHKISRRNWTWKEKRVFWERIGKLYTFEEDLLRMPKSFLEIYYRSVAAKFRDSKWKDSLDSRYLAEEKSRKQLQKEHGKTAKKE